MGNMKVLFRAQHGDVGPWDLREEDVSYQAWQERVFQTWPDSTCPRSQVEREGENNEGDGSKCPPSVSRADGLTEDDIKFIWNGRVLSTTEELKEVCTRYFGTMEHSAGRVTGEGGDTMSVLSSAPADKVLILHAVVRPPVVPMKRKGKKGVEEGAGGSVQQGDGVCSCCVIS